MKGKDIRGYPYQRYPPTAGCNWLSRIEEGGKPEYPRKNPQSQMKINWNSAHLWPEASVEPGSQRWEAWLITVKPPWLKIKLWLHAWHSCFNRPFPSSCLPPLQSESECKHFVTVILVLLYIRMKSNFLKKNFALRIDLKTRKLLIPEYSPNIRCIFSKNSFLLVPIKENMINWSSLFQLNDPVFAPFKL